jgi:xylan 1,4-beta-xylosidase
MINYQDIKKPSYRAYELLNKLGPSKLQCQDPEAIITKDGHGVQALFWDFTNTVPDHENNQAYYITDIKPHHESKVKLQIDNLEKGSYKVSIYRVGYRINDPYADYLDLGRPGQLSRPQVEMIKKKNDGKPVSTESVDIQSGDSFQREYTVRENDVYLVQIAKDR